MPETNQSSTNKKSTSKQSKPKAVPPKGTGSTGGGKKNNGRQKSQCSCNQNDLSDQPTVTQLYFYQSLFKQASMGEESLKTIKPHIEEQSLRTFVSQQLRNYKTYKQELYPLISKLGEEPDEAPLMTRLMMKSGVAFNTMMNNSSSKIAEIIMQGVNMGVISVTRLLNTAESQGLEVDLGNKMMTLYEQQIDVLKNYL